MDIWISLWPCRCYLLQQICSSASYYADLLFEKMIKHNYYDEDSSQFDVSEQVWRHSWSRNGVYCIQTNSLKEPWAHRNYGWVPPPMAWNNYSPSPPPPQGLCTYLYTGRRETINVTSMEINNKTNDCYLLLLGELISVSKIKKRRRRNWKSILIQLFIPVMSEVCIKGANKGAVWCHRLWTSNTFYWSVATTHAVKRSGIKPWDKEVCRPP